ncbi:MAG: molybdopterin molybdotransferase MoeA [Desulfobacterales bacterium]|nr:molybdopterin molybdotransferase MoeA [Desulfobacterales bacterium]
MKTYDIGYSHAIELAMMHLTDMPSEKRSVLEANNRVVSKDIIAKVNSPDVNASMKDGFAVISSDIEMASPSTPVELDVIDIVEAGSTAKKTIKSGQTIRILSGAPIPYGADAVLTEEFARVENNKIFALADAHKGRNILFQGSDVKKDEVLIHRHTTLTPSNIALLSAGGVSQVDVYKKPKVGLLATGNEVLLIGSLPEQGKLFASNIALQQAWLSAFGIETRVSISTDSFPVLSSAIQDMYSDCDVIITSGGAWKGDRDFIIQVLDMLGWHLIFHRVRMGPGKAVGMGMLNGKPVFCLPGGPPSNEMAFLMIALPCILKMTGFQSSPFLTLYGRLDSDLQGQKQWTNFFHCLISRDKHHLVITPLPMERRLSSMAKTQAIVCIPEEMDTISKNHIVPCCCLDIKAIRDSISEPCLWTQKKAFFS